MNSNFLRQLKVGFFFACIVILFCNCSKAQSKLRIVNNNSFQQGEYIKYFIYYGWFDAGEATLEVNKKTFLVNNRSCYQINGKGYSIGFFEWFFKVRDNYTTYIDKIAILPWESLRDVSEYDYHTKEHLIFNHFQDSVKSLNKSYKVPDNTLEIISAIYYARCIDYSKAKLNQKFNLSYFVLEDAVYPLQIEYIGKETIETDLGIFDCIILKPLLVEGRVFSGQKDMTMWVTNDESKIPIRIKTDILVGSIKMDLVEYSNLKRPINIKKLK